jgi:hypothetical protein
MRGRMSKARSPFGRDQVDDRSRRQSRSLARGADGVHSSPSPSPSALSGEIASKADPDCDIPSWARAPTDVEPSTGGPRLSRRQSTTCQTDSVRSSPRSPLEPNTSQSGNQRRPARRAATLQPLLTVTEIAEFDFEKVSRSYPDRAAARRSRLLKEREGRRIRSRLPGP